jgi:hypothetical protein
MSEFRGGLVVTLLVSFGISFVPLLGTAGPESALVLALVLSPFYAGYGAASVRSLAGKPWRDAVFLAAKRAGAGLAIVEVVLYLSGLRAGACEPLLGAAWLAVGAGPSLLLASLVGLWMPHVVFRRRIAIALAVSVPIGEAVFAAVRFYASPAVFSYGHFFGYFPGTLYDEDIRITSTLLAFRATTLLAATALAALGTASIASVGEPASARSLRHHSPSLFVGLLLASVFVATSANATRLGFAASADSLRERLGGVAEGARCTVVVPRELPRESARLLAADCDFRIAQHEAALGVIQAERVTAFFFRNADEKREAMGAAHVYIAKPWRSEVYLQLSDWPHPVLSHELAHVVSGAVAPRPFRVSVSGIIPNPGYIEGIAVALAWAESDELDPHEWTRAMRSLGHSPRLRDLLGTGFFLGAANRSYTAAGSFFRFVLDRYGAAVLRRAYARGDVEGATGKTLAVLEAEWLAFLNTLPDDPHANALAAIRFERGPIFERICPHLVARLQEELASARAAGDIATTLARCDAIVGLDPSDTRTRLAAIEALMTAGNRELAADRVERMRDLGLPASLIVRAEEVLADARWALGEPPTIPFFERIARSPRGRDAARTFEVKRFAVEQGGETARWVGEILAKRAPGARTAQVMDAIDSLRAARNDGLADYLSARQLVQESAHERALARLDAALTSGLPLVSLEREAHRMATRSLFALGRYDESESHIRWSLENAPTAVERNEANDWRMRVEHARRNALQHSHAAH